MTTYQGKNYGHCRFQCEGHGISLGGCKCMGPHDIVTVPCPDSEHHRKKVAELEAKAAEPAPEPTIPVELTKHEVVELRILVARHLRELGGGVDPRIQHGEHIQTVNEMHAEGVVLYDKLGRAQAREHYPH